MILSKDPDLEQDLYEVFEIFEEMPEGEMLAKRYRYSKYFHPDLTGGVVVSKDRIMKLLGHDANCSSHLQATYLLSQAFTDMMADEFSAEEKNVLMLAALTHDCAEYEAGDKTYDEHTEEVAVAEKKLLNPLLRDIFDKLDLSYSSDNVVDIAYDSEHPLFPAFNCIERLGYMRNAIEAWKQSSGDGKDIEANLKWLASNVLGNQIPTLIDYSYKFDAPGYYLGEFGNLISEMFEEMPEYVFAYYEEGDEHDVNREKFYDAKKKWVKFWDRISAFQTTVA